MPVTQASSYPSPQQVCRRQSTTNQLNDVKAGCILWLPRKDKIKEYLLEGMEIDDGCFNHPVLVLSTEPAQGKASVLIVSILLSICLKIILHLKYSANMESLLPLMVKISQ